MRGNLRTIIGVAAITALLVAPATVWAADRFTDVPDSNVFHDDISWLADAGVTLGCNPPDNTRFCPDNVVTRAQMAAFMKRLAENQVVDAGSVGGATADELGVIATGTQFDWLTQGSIEVSTTGVQLLELPIDVPVDGVAVLNAALTREAGVAGDFQMMWVSLDNDACIGDAGSAEPADYILGSISYDDVQTLSAETSMSSTASVSLSAGSHTLYLCAVAEAGGEVWSAGLTAVFSPSGSVLTPASLQDDAAGSGPNS